MENAEEIFQVLEEFSKRKPKTIPQELNEYLAYVARTGDPVYQWVLVKSLFKEKLLNVITDFYETTPGIDIPPYPNVDPFNYDIMKDSLLERLDSFTSAPFTVQRICELLTYPRKQYNRVDKFMRAIEKNILVVSTREPGLQRHIEQENGEPTEPIVNGSDNNSDYNVDVEMEDVSWKENTEQQNAEPQPSSSDSHITVDNIESSPQTKQDDPMDTQEKSNIQSDTVVTPVQNEQGDTPQMSENKMTEPLSSESAPLITETSQEVLKSSDTPLQTDSKDVEMKPDVEPNVLVIPEIKVDDAEMTEQKLIGSDNSVVSSNDDNATHNESEKPIASEDPPQVINDDTCSSNVSKEDAIEPKVLSEVSTSSEESSSSSTSDNTDGNSNSPKTDPEAQTDVPVESINDSSNKDVSGDSTKTEEIIDKTTEQTQSLDSPPKVTIETDNYSISDVNSEIKEIPPKTDSESEEIKAKLPHSESEEKTHEKTEDKPAEISEAENTDKESSVS